MMNADKNFSGYITLTQTISIMYTMKTHQLLFVKDFISVKNIETSSDMFIDLLKVKVI